MMSVCTVGPDELAAAQRFVAEWYANDPYARRAGLMEGLERFPDLMPRPIDDLTLTPKWPCVASDRHSMWNHEWMRNVQLLARLEGRAHALRRLDEFAGSYDVPPIETHRLAPYIGDATTSVPAHLERLLAALGEKQSDYLYLRNRYTSARREGASRHERFRREEGAKYLRLLHAVGAAMNGIDADPDFGDVPAEPTEPEFLSGVNVSKLREYAAAPDGHGFVDADYFTEMGFHPDVVATFTREHESDLSNPMNTIFDDDGNVIRSLVGVNELEFLWITAVELGADITQAAWKHGRGAQARELGAAIIATPDVARTSVND